jgi:hypothetical protein
VETTAAPALEERKVVSVLFCDQIFDYAYRANDGVEVTLLWSRASGCFSNTKAGDTFELPAHPENALDVFYHPYAYAAGRGIRYALGTPAASAEALAA